MILSLLGGLQPGVAGRCLDIEFHFQDQAFFSTFEDFEKRG